MRELSIDIETFSDVDLKSSGVYRYAESAAFEVLLFAFTYGGAPRVIDLANGEKIPDRVIQDMKDPAVKKTAHNAAFERVCLSKHLGQVLDPSSWFCTMALCAQMGLPLSLDQAASALKLEEGKMAEGKPLIRFFCMPCKPTLKNNQRTRNLPEHAPGKWEIFKKYCAQDVVVEQAIKNKIDFEFPETEKAIWNLDQKINDTGVLLDPVLVRNAIKFDLAFADQLTKECANLTGLFNPNSVAQIKDWILEETGEEVKSLNKETVPVLIKNAPTDTIKRVLELRQQMSKTSVKKYLAMHRHICKDQRFRGIVQYYGARTGRFAGRGVQVHNLPKNSMSDLDLARQIVKAGDIQVAEMCYSNIPSTLSELIRTAFVAPAGSRLIPSDFSAIEARVLAWLAGEQWRLDVFNTHGKIYEASAAHMFKVPLEAVTKASDYRQKAKIAELALGYQGSVGALLQMGAVKMGVCDAVMADAEKKWPEIRITSGLWGTLEEYKDYRIEKELKNLVDQWRAANQKIVDYWYEIGNAAVYAVESGEIVGLKHGIFMYVKKDIFLIKLPSGRCLAYQSPKLKAGKYGEVLTFMGVDKTWHRQDTYGGKLVENIVQAVARDLLADAMIRVDAAGYKIVLHVHDEIVPEMPYGQGSAEEIKNIMSQPISWAKGLPLGADAYETEYYKKD